MIRWYISNTSAQWIPS